MTTTERARQWDQMWLPLWPLASDDLLTGVYRRSRQYAMHRRYIEANPRALSNLLVVDIDHEDFVLRLALHVQNLRLRAQEQAWSRIPGIGIEP